MFVVIRAILFKYHGRQWYTADVNSAQHVALPEKERLINNEDNTASIEMQDLDGTAAWVTRTLLLLQLLITCHILLFAAGTQYQLLYLLLHHTELNLTSMFIQTAAAIILTLNVISSTRFLSLYFSTAPSRSLFGWFVPTLHHIIYVYKGFTITSHAHT